MQDRETHTWQDNNGQPGGLTALCTLAILNSGVPATDERVRPALDYLCAGGKPTMVYSSSLTIMALAAAYPTAKPEKRTLYAARIKEHALWLQAVQISDGERKGGWRYSRESGQGDNSNSQFALLGLHEAERILTEAAAHPLVKAALETFPGAAIEAVRDLGPAEARPEGPDGERDEVSGEEP
jgi:hypothetical protein